MSKAIIDYDSGVYAMASACDGRKWEYRGRTWELKKVAEKALAREGKDPSELRLIKEPEEWSSVETTVRRYTDNFIENLEDSFDYQLYIKGGGNFRYNVASILPYKGDRTEEPKWREDISQMLVDEYGAKRVYNVEVDDALGILSNEDNIILVHIDKDIEQVPGIHYNPNTCMRYEIDRIEGLRKVYAQCIIGDSTDCILGLYGVGKKSTHIKKMEDMQTEEELYEHVLTLYKQRFGTYAESFFRENMILAWMMRPANDPYLWQEELLDEEWMSFYMDPHNTMEIK